MDHGPPIEPSSGRNTNHRPSTDDRGDGDHEKNIHGAGITVGQVHRESATYDLNAVKDQKQAEWFVLGYADDVDTERAHIIESKIDTSKDYNYLSRKQGIRRFFEGGELNHRSCAVRR